MGKPMPHAKRDTNSLSHFKRNSGALIRHLKKTGKPITLTVHGKAEVVVQDARAYQALLELVDRLEATEGIRRGLEEMKTGQGCPAAEVFEEIRRKYQIA